MTNVRRRSRRPAVAEGPARLAWRVARYAWAAPTTALGLAVVAAGCRRARLRIVDGVLEAHGPVLSKLLTGLPFVPGGAAALTLGHVVIGRDAHSLESTRAHERVHVRQCERWGPLFVPAYLAAGAWAMLRGRDAYFGNVFEREAYTHRARPGDGAGEPEASRPPITPSTTRTRRPAPPYPPATPRC